jgi:hypothetical protein
MRRLRRSEGLSISEISRVLGVLRNTVKSALASDGPPQYRRAPAGSVVDAVDPRIREVLKAFPTMPATVIEERVGWSHSIRTLSARVSETRPVYLYHPDHARPRLPRRRRRDRTRPHTRTRRANRAHRERVLATLRRPSTRLNGPMTSPACTGGDPPSGAPRRHEARASRRSLVGKSVRASAR